jgi:hypothetical protein
VELRLFVVATRAATFFYSALSSFTPDGFRRSIAAAVNGPPDYRRRSVTFISLLTRKKRLAPHDHLLRSTIERNIKHVGAKLVGCSYEGRTRIRLRPLGGIFPGSGNALANSAFRGLYGVGWDFIANRGRTRDPCAAGLGVLASSSGCKSDHRRGGHCLACDHYGRFRSDHGGLGARIWMLDARLRFTANLKEPLVARSERRPLSPLRHSDDRCSADRRARSNMVDWRLRPCSRSFPDRAGGVSAKPIFED